MHTQRPVAITILGRLAIIGGIVGVLASLAVFGGGGVLPSGGVHTLLSVVLLAVSVGDIVLGIGLLRLKPWAWTFGIGLQAAAIVLDLLLIALGNSVSSQLFSILFGAVIIYYLYRPEAKQAFGHP